MKRIIVGILFTGTVFYFGIKYYFEFQAKKKLPNIDEEFSDLLE
jgi:hypothetical protein